jgi:hypothetical protein
MCHRVFIPSVGAYPHLCAEVHLGIKTKGAGVFILRGVLHAPGACVHLCSLTACAHPTLLS